MRILIQRVRCAAVRVDGETVGEIGPGLLLFVGLGGEDSASAFPKIIEKVTKLRIFPDDEDRFDRSVEDIGGGILTVSQFTLYGDLRRGRRPSFSAAMPPAQARALYAEWVGALRLAYTAGPVADGQFAAMMDVDLVNDGPVTLWLDTREFNPSE
ncbi:MAG: D-aminoacyl-tRNA deacylase [Sumerlaeia bacterium]